MEFLRPVRSGRHKETIIIHQICQKKVLFSARSTFFDPENQALSGEKMLGAPSGEWLRSCIGSGRRSLAIVAFLQFIFYFATMAGFSAELARHLEHNHINYITSTESSFKCIKCIRSND